MSDWKSVLKADPTNNLSGNLNKVDGLIVYIRVI